MQYSFLKSCLLAIATASSVVLAQTSGFNVMTKPLVGEAVPANTVYDIVWTPSAAYPGKISIVFYGGSAANTLAVISTVASGIDPSVGKFSWSVPADAGSLAAYGLRINLDSDASVYQWSNGFTIKAVAGGSTTATSSTTTVPGSTTTIKISQVSTITSTTSTSTTTSSASSTTTTTTVSSSATSKTSSVIFANTTLTTATMVPTTATGVSTSATTSPSSSAKPTNGANSATVAGTSLLTAMVFSLAMLL